MYKPLVRFHRRAALGLDRRIEHHYVTLMLLPDRASRYPLL
jgi:hypothetical protein